MNPLTFLLVQVEVFIYPLKYFDIYCFGMAG